MLDASTTTGSRIVKRLRAGLIVKAQRFLYSSASGWRIMTKKRRRREGD
jgi:hypothetical protein